MLVIGVECAPLSGTLTLRGVIVRSPPELDEKCAFFMELALQT